MPYLELNWESGSVLLLMTFMNCIHDLGLSDLYAIEHGSMRGMISLKNNINDL